MGPAEETISLPDRTIVTKSLAVALFAQAGILAILPYLYGLIGHAAAMLPTQQRIASDRSHSACRAR